MYNRKHKCGRSIIENSLGTLKNNNRKLIGIYNLHITFILDVSVYCCLLHNLLHNQGDLQVERLAHILKKETDNTQQAQNLHFDDQVHPHNIEGPKRSKNGLRRELTNYLGLQHVGTKNERQGKC